ncbi:hypothetical protein K6W76_01290 [Burkholderia anthina]|uniref:hypothetical protein n=1 Tax=Burkholderia anthina TaxID=179879 RepID=UPI0015884AAF|nr:hypothetical protein [Burkholderia anthina]MBY4865154.1 hypothetical protein [Burkholderia anthina]
MVRLREQKTVVAETSWLSFFFKVAFLFILSKKEKEQEMSNARRRNDAKSRIEWIVVLSWRSIGERIFRAWRVAFVLIFAACALLADSAGAQVGAAVGSNAGQMTSPTDVATLCIIVRDSIFGKSWLTFSTPDQNPLSTGGMDSKCIDLTSSFESSNTGNSNQPVFGPLTGAGDLVIAVDRDQYDQAQQKLQSTPGSFVLYLNGVPLPHDATVESAQYIDKFVALRYRIHQGPEVQRLWSMLYADGSLFTSQRLYASLGWQPDTANGPALIPERSKVFASIRITTGLKLTLALLLVAATIGVLFYTGIATDTIRDAGTPAWWTTAARTWRVVATMKGATAQDKYLADEFPGKPDMPAYDAAKRPQYAAAAISALERNVVDESDAAKVSDTIYGLALSARRWTPVRGTFSLSRTQLALWFAFTIATGLFLWLVYGELRRIDGSLLVLLGISLGTAGVSWVSDRTVAGRPYEPSAGFWLDLITGFDDNQQQLYRYQAVVVNLLLLLVGVYHVTQQLAYPVFDPTWLIFLGISGSAYGIGKQLNETK